MRFLVTIHADDNLRKGTPPNPQLMAAIMKSGEELTKAGKMIFTGGLGLHGTATEVRTEGGKLFVTDGPFTETKELICGFAIFDVASKEEILKLTEDFMRMHIEHLGPQYKGVCEIHQIMGGP